MAIKLVVNIAKKIPGPSEYSSVQASCSIEGELSAGQHPQVEAARLFSQAEAAVNQQLGHVDIKSVAPTPVQRWTPPTVSNNTTPNQSQSPQRRSPAPVTESQLRFITRLLDAGKGSRDAILAQHQVGDLRDLSCKAAASVIDTLKAVT